MQSIPVRLQNCTTFLCIHTFILQIQNAQKIGFTEREHLFHKIVVPVQILLLGYVHSAFECFQLR